jgi:hypothetical protein
MWMFLVHDTFLAECNQNCRGDFAGCLRGKLHVPFRIFAGTVQEAHLEETHPHLPSESAELPRSFSDSGGWLLVSLTLVV